MALARKLRRAAVLTAGILALATAPAAHAATTGTGYHPSAADFADCPPLPADAVRSTWTCFAETVLSGTVQLNQEGAVITQPLRVTVAQGSTLARGTVAVWGGLANGGPMPMLYGLVGSPFSVPEPHGWQVQFAGTGLVKPGLIVPYLFGLTGTITGTGLGGGCTVGSAAEPVVVQPQLQWFFPISIDGVPMMKVAEDAIFGMPSAEGCGGIPGVLLANAFVGLPAPTTADHLTAQWAIRTQKY